MMQRTGIDIIESYLTKAEVGDPNDTPIIYDENESKAYHQGLRDAYLHSLEMLNSATFNKLLKSINWDGALEALDRCLEEHWQREHPFQNPVNQDARLALYEITKLISFLKRI